MAQVERLTDTELQALLRSAQDLRSPASLRAHGSHRMLGDLCLRGMEPGEALHLVGAKRRDQLPDVGTPMTLTLLLGEDVVSLDAPFLSPLTFEGDMPPILRLGWPQEGIQRHPRREMRVAAPQQNPLTARILVEGKAHDGLLLNLTETGLGLALRDALLMELHARVRVDTVLPEGTPFGCEGEIRHFTHLEGDAYPTRIGLSIAQATERDMERLRTFIQLRRTDRSESLRQPGGH